MITKHDLLEAIAECQGVRSPNANTAVKLAAFYTILDHLDDEEKPAEKTASNTSLRGYSFADSDSSVVQFDGDSDFANIVNGRKQDEILPVIDELMTTIRLMNERLYNGVMRKLQ